MIQTQALPVGRSTGPAGSAGWPPGGTAPALRAVSHHLPILVGLTILGIVSYTGVWWWANRRALAERQGFRMIPTDVFDPSPEELRRWAAALATTRRRVVPLTRRSQAIRFRLTAEPGGRVEMYVTCPRRAAGLLEAACPHQVELQRVEPDGSRPRVFTRPAPERSRAEVVLSRRDRPLAVLDLAPDPLAPLVGALADLRPAEAAEVLVDVQPVPAGRRRRELAAALRRDRSTTGHGADPIGSVLTTLTRDPLGSSRRPAGGLDLGLWASGPGALKRLEANRENRDRHARLSPAEPAFEAQVLLWAQAPTRHRRVALVDSLVAGLVASADRNAWRRAGLHLGFLHLNTADSASRRVGFDRRVETGRFRPRRRSVVTAGEIAGLLKPPTVRCGASNVLRSGGLVPAPPPGLPTWAPGTAGLWPLGEVQERGTARVVGVPLADTFFSANFGRSRFGKTELAIVRAIALSRDPSEPGVIFLDPHGDALERMRPYLVGQADRVVEVNLGRHATATQAGWNPLAMTGLTAADIEDRVQPIVGAFMATQGWDGQKNTRSINMVTQAARALCELGLVLPPDLQPTLFQIDTILSDERWRTDVLRHLSNTSRAFWLNKFSHQTGGLEAITPTTNAIDQLRATRHVAALFGQPRSTFDMRASMDAGKIILLGPGGDGPMEQLVHAIMLLEMFRATSSRRDIVDVTLRRPVHAFCDELQVADRGSASDLLCRMLREGAKFGLRLHAMVQQPTSLTKQTLTAMFTNRSHLLSTAVEYESGAVLARNTGGVVEPTTFTTLRRYHHLASVTVAGEISPPFRVRGLSVDETWGDPADGTAVAALERQIDATMRRRPVGDVLAELETLDARILDALRDIRPRPSGTVPGAEPPEPARRQPRRLQAVTPEARGWTAG